MSPASYLTAPPRVATGSIPPWRRFSGLRWRFLVLAAVAGAALIGVRAWRTWQALVSLLAAGSAAAERLATSAQELMTRAEHVAGRAEELQAAAERLERSSARLRTLTRATAEARDLLRAVLAFAPR